MPNELDRIDLFNEGAAPLTPIEVVSPSFEPETQESGLGLSGGGLQPLPFPHIGAGVGDAGAFDQSGSAGTDLGFAGRAGVVSPLGRRPEDVDFLKSLPTAAKIGLMLEAFGAGVQGKAPMIERLIQQKRAADREHRQDMLATTTILTKAMEEIRRYGPDTIQGRAVATAYKQALGPELGPVLDAIGTPNEGKVGDVLGLLDSPGVQKMLEQTCSMSPNRRECWLKFMSDDTNVKRARDVRNNELMPGITEKLSKLKPALEGGALAQFADKDGKIAWAKIVELNAEHKLFTPQEMDAIKDNQAALIPYGIVTDEAMKQGQITAARVAEKSDRRVAIGTKQTIHDAKTGRAIEQRLTGYDEDGDPVWETVGGKPAPAPKAAKPEKPEKPLTDAQAAAIENKAQAIARLKAAGIDPTTGNGSEKLEKYQAGGILPNKGYIGDTRAAQLKADLKLAQKVLPGEVRQQRGGAAPAAGAQAQKGQLSPADQQKLIAAVNAKLAKGGDPEKIKKWAKDTYGIDLKIGRKQ